VSRTAGWCAQAVLACAAVWTGAALADEGPFTPGSSTQLTLDHYSETFSYPDGPRTFDVSEYSVGYYEPVAEDVALGLQGGYLTINVDNDKLASLIAYSGQFLGFMGRYQSTWGDYLNFAAEIRYLWHDQQGQLSGQQSDITWYETYARAGPVLRYGPLRFELGGYYQNNSGNETDTGNVNQRRDISSHGGGAYAGLVLYVEPTGSVALYGYGGARHEVRLVFTREFD
jgi:hypothetical protein